MKPFTARNEHFQITSVLNLLDARNIKAMCSDSSFVD
jgi:hypothetical protein